MESTVLVRSGFFLVAVVVKVWKYIKTLNFGSLGKPVSFVFPRVLIAKKCFNKRGLFLLLCIKQEWSSKSFLVYSVNCMGTLRHATFQAELIGEYVIDDYVLRSSQ